MKQLQRAGDNVRAVGRALEVLLAFTPKDFELSASELLDRVGLRRPTLYRLLYTLEEKGFIVSIGDPQRFRLGPAVARLAHTWTSSLDLFGVAEPVMRRLWTATGETVALFVPQGPLRLCVAELPSSQPLNFKRGIGYTERIARGASGRAILAHLHATREELVAYTEGTSIDVGTLAKELAQTRKRGYATSRNELIQGAVSAAAPFFDRNGGVAGSIGVFGPGARIQDANLKQLGVHVAKEAAELSSALGFSAPAPRRGLPSTGQRS